jgi:phage tail-like protein
MFTDPTIIPLHVFRFHVDFFSDSLVDSDDSEPVEVCSGAFAECTGLEATMEPKTIKEGGRNYGPAQRAGGVTFATVVLKRGVSANRNLWQVFNTTSSGLFAPRLQVMITLLDGTGAPVMGWQLDRAMPVKFKFADFNAKAMEIGIEELHLVHEGMSAI